MLRGNVVDLAVGVVIGAAFGAVVQAIVKDILTPLVQAFGRGADLATVAVTIGGIVFPIGDVLQALISFILIALVVVAMRKVAAPSGADIADHAARVLADRLTGESH